MTDTDLNPFLLAANTPSPDHRLLPLLRSNPSIAAQQDSHGYSLLHAAASYDHVDLLRELVQNLNVDVNLVDEDGETCLFVAETFEAAKCLVEELRIDISIKNHDGQTALQKIIAEEDYPEVAAYLRGREGGFDKAVSTRGAVSSSSVACPPPLPANIKINFDTIDEEQLTAVNGGEPDSEFRRRIEELAAKENFSSEEGQKELRDLITDAVRDVNSEDREVRRRVE